MAEAPPYFVAMEELFPVVTASGAFALLQGAARSGLVGCWLAGATPAEAARSCGLEPEVVEAVAGALLASDVLAEDEGVHRLGPAWRALLSSDALIAPADLLGRFAVESRLLETLGEGQDYWSLSAQDRLTYARGISPDPSNPAVVTMLTNGVLADPDLVALHDGGSLLELGCGVSGRTLALLQGLPSLRVVGVELADDLVDEAARRADRLGVADRFELVRADAATFSRPGAFDVAFWSQFFFPAASRAGALAAIHQSLRPGGILQAPLAADFAAMEADPTGPMARYYALSRVVHASWDVPERRPMELQAELESAGFVEVQVRGGGAAGPQRVRAVRP